MLKVGVLPLKSYPLYTSSELIFPMLLQIFSFGATRWFYPAFFAERFLHSPAPQRFVSSYCSDTRTPEESGQVGLLPVAHFGAQKAPRVRRH